MTRPLRAFRGSARERAIARRMTAKAVPGLGVLAARDYSRRRPWGMLDAGGPGRASLAPVELVDDLGAAS
jgi:hypothetical protein